MRPLPTSVCPDKPRRSKRPRRGVSGRTSSVEVRCEPRERDRWIHAAGREGYLALSDWIRDRLNASASTRIHYSSVDETWNTPSVVLRALAPLGPIGLDPCSNPTSIVVARTAWILARDGDSLARSWGGHGLVFVNPPYGDELPRWVAKCAAEAASGVELVMLVPARTDTQWWNLAIERGTAALWRGRLVFLGAPSSAPFPCALIYMGPRWRAFRTILSDLSTGIVEPRKAAA